MKKYILALALLCALRTSFADTAECKIEIEDIVKGTTYTIEQKFDYEPEQELDFEKGDIGHWKHFDLPGADYACHLVFYEIDKGTMISCEYKGDQGHTFFQSDRSVLRNKTNVNKLTFRHKKAFISLESTCE